MIISDKHFACRKTCSAGFVQLDVTKIRNNEGENKKVRSGLHFKVKALNIFCFANPHQHMVSLCFLFDVWDKETVNGLKEKQDDIRDTKTNKDVFSGKCSAKKKHPQGALSTKDGDDGKRNTDLAD